MKKLLALVLALVMTMSLVTISNAAFKDADSIDYKEAVDVMNAVGVFVGDEKGNFNAKENLTREQAAKIIAYLELGDKAADAMVGGNTFTDVAASRWSAGYIAYCAQAGIVSGVGDSKFDPAGQLTALQFAKMLLVELGYDAKAEGMVGTDWAINTSKLMATAKLMDGIDGSVNAVITREKAAQMCLNALEAPMVTYDTKGSTITVDGTKINFGASVAKYETSTIAKDQNISRNKLTSGEYTVELGEKLYKDLKKISTTDAFDRPATNWKNKTTNIGTYGDSADLTYTAEVKLGTIYSDLGLSKAMAASNVEFHLNGATEAASGNDNSSSPVALDTLGLVKGASNKIGGNGVLVEVFYDNDAETAVITMINTYAGEVKAVKAATSARDAYINVAPAVSGVGASGDFETEADFDVDDIVLYTYSVKSGEGIQEVVPAETISGTVNAYTESKNITVDGTVYSANKVYASKITGLTGAVGYDATLVLDKYGYVVNIDTSAADKNYAVVLAHDSNSIDGGRAKLLFTDGTTQTVNLKNTTINNANATDIGVNVGDIVSYSVDGNNKYTLAVKADAFQATTTTLVTKNSAAVNASNKSANAYAASNRNEASSFNGKTIFLIASKSGADTVYNAYTGIANVPTVTLAAANQMAIYAKTVTGSPIASGAATVVYINATGASDSVSSTSKDWVFVKGSTVGQSYTAQKGNFYTYTAIINGEITTIETTTQTTADTLYNTVSYDKNGVATLGGGVKSGTATWGAVPTTDGAIYDASNGTKVEANGVVGVGGSYYAYADDCVVFVKDEDGNLSQSSVSAITDDANDVVFAKFKDGEITVIVIAEVADGVVAPSSYAWTGTAAASVSSGTLSLTGIKLQNSSVDCAATNLKASYDVYYWNTSAGGYVKLETVESPATATVISGTTISTELNATTTLPASVNFKVVATVTCNELTSIFTLTGSST